MCLVVFPTFFNLSEFAIRKSDAGLKYIREKPCACHFCCKYFPNPMFSCDLRMRKKYDVFRKKQYTRVFIGRRKRFLLISEDKRLCWDKL